MDRGLSPAHQRLNHARALARDGRYEEALQEHLWFHEHALKEEPALTAVRLSYAIHDWADLGKLYPKAQSALEAARDRAVERVLAGDAGSWNAFQEVSSINGYLGCEDKTYALFQQLATSNEQLARRCARVALPSILQARDYPLAGRFMRDPMLTILDESRFLNRVIRLRRQRQFSPAPYIKVEISLYAERVREMLAVLEGCGQLTEARQLRAVAVRLIKATTIRDAVEAALKRGARPWYERARTPGSRHRRA